MPGGGFVKIYPTKDDLSVARFHKETDEKPYYVTHHTHHPFAVNSFREFAGLDPIEYGKPKVRQWANTEDDGHEHDWEWDNPDNDEDNGIHCGLCGVAGEMEEED